MTSDFNGMKRETLVDALAEAERFLRVGKAALKSFRRVKASDGSFEWWDYSSPLHAAAKRASMDATRALARFRRGIA